MSKKAPSTPLEGVSKNCASCEFFRPSEEVETEVVGHCNRYPPRVVIDTDGDICTAWPAVSGFEWCGEFRGRQ